MEELITATEPQIIANRRNPQKSTGPRTCDAMRATSDERRSYAKQTQFAGSSNERKLC
jgi:hypothetical protein